MTTTETAESGTESTTTASRAPHACACLTGTDQVCDRTTQKAFAQGHDAKMASRLAKLVADKDDPMTADAAESLIRDAGGSDLLVGKMRHSATLRATSASKPPRTKAPKEKAASEHARADTAEAKAVASAGNGLLGSTVQVHHHGQKGDKTYDAVVVRNAAGDMIARHRLIGNNCDHSVDAEGTTGEKVK